MKEICKNCKVKMDWIETDGYRRKWYCHKCFKIILKK